MKMNAGIQRQGNVKRYVLLSQSATGEQSRARAEAINANCLVIALTRPEQQQQHFGEYYSYCC